MTRIGDHIERVARQASRLEYGLAVALRQSDLSLTDSWKREEKGSSDEPKRRLDWHGRPPRTKKRRSAALAFLAADAQKIIAVLECVKQLPPFERLRLDGFGSRFGGFF
jgi:hypothetical protein